MEAVGATAYGPPIFVVQAVDFFVIWLSNSGMRQRLNMSNILLKIIAVVFLLNSTAAFATCHLSARGDTTVKKMSCHLDSDAENQLNPDDCCLMCVAIMVSINTLGTSAPIGHDFFAPVASGVVSIGLDPPFRPPIHHQ